MSKLKFDLVVLTVLHWFQSQSRGFTMIGCVLMHDLVTVVPSREYVSISIHLIMNISVFHVITQTILKDGCVLYERKSCNIELRNFTTDAIVTKSSYYTISNIGITLTLSL